MTDLVSTQVSTRISGYYPAVQQSFDEDTDLEPYAALFQKPFATNKCAFSRPELEAMCRDPLHSPRLILYLIDIISNI